jgi:hypothetical protein
VGFIAGQDVESLVVDGSLAEAVGLIEIFDDFTNRDNGTILCS